RRGGTGRFVPSHPSTGWRSQDVHFVDDRPSPSFRFRFSSSAPFPRMSTHIVCIDRERERSRTESRFTQGFGVFRVPLSVPAFSSAQFRFSSGELKDLARGKRTGTGEPFLPPAAPIQAGDRREPSQLPILRPLEP